MADHCNESVPTAFQTISYVQAASAAALFFDFFITFSSEVHWTWGRKWGIVRTAFVISRYLPLVSFAMNLYHTAGTTRGGIPNLGRDLAINGTMNIFCGAAADALLVARIYAFCALEKRILIAISFFVTAINVTAVTILIVVTSHPENCVRYYGVFEGERCMSIYFGLLAIYQLVLVSLTLHKRFKFYQQENTPLIVTVYRDGVIYMLCIVLASVANCVGYLVLPLSYTSLFTSPQAVVYSVVASRILFNLRATNESPDAVLIGPVASGMVFAQPIRTPSGVDRLELRDITDL